MTRAKARAIRIRWSLLVLWVLCVICAIVWLFGGFISDTLGVGLGGTPGLLILGPAYRWFEDAGRWAYVLLVLIYLALMFLTQWWFLGPRHIWKIEVAEAPRPMKRAAVGAAFAATLLTVGFVCSIADLTKKDFFDPLLDPSTVWQYIILLIPAVVWFFWCVILIIYLRQGEHYNWAGKIIRALIAGSVLELFVAVPVYATSKQECYCARGSYAGLVFGGTVLLWAFGPGVFLLFVREKQRRRQVTT
jgi:hypothetical protein